MWFFYPQMTLHDVPKSLFSNFQKKYHVDFFSTNDAPRRSRKTNFRISCGFFFHKWRSTIYPVCGFFFHNLQIGVKDTPVIQASRHGLRVDIFMKKRFGRFSWFFRNIIYNPKGKKCGLDFSCKSLYLTVFVHLKNLRTFRIFTVLQETVHV